MERELVFHISSLVDEENSKKVRLLEEATVMLMPKGTTINVVMSNKFVKSTCKTHQISSSSKRLLDLRRWIKFVPH